MYYLRPEVYFEPLFNHWYAWPYLIPPVQGSRHTTNTHLRIMKSFVNNYQLHIAACQDPAMAGSDYMDCSAEQVADIEKLIHFTQEQCSELIALSNGVKELDELLRSHTSGESIEGLYEQIPEPLQGYVELFFDLEHNPSYRLIEGLLYKSQYYREDLQTASFGLVSDVNDRPFVFSTPRLPDENHVHLKLHFNSPVLARILSARENGLSEDELTEIEQYAKAQSGKRGIGVRDLFTQTPPEKCNPVQPNKLRLQYAGHAGFLIETSKVSILVDPVIASSHDKIKEDVFSHANLPDKIDYICLTHSHQDHVNLETLLQLRHKTGKVLVPKNNGGALQDPSLKLMLKTLQFNVIEMEDLEEIAIADGKIVSLPFLGEHGDLNIRSKTAWFVEIAGRKVFLGADSSNLDPNMYRHLKKVIGDIDVLAIGMECVGAPYTWLYGALHSKRVSRNIKESRRLNGCDGETGFNLVNLFNPQQVFIYALGMEPWFKYFMGLEYDDESEQMIQSAKLIELCEQTDIPCEKLFGRKVVEYDYTEYD